MINREEWRDVPEYEGLYQVSSFGNVKSLSREILKNGKYPFISKEKLLKPKIGTTGYYNVGLSKNNKRKMFQVHQLVAICFLNHKPNGYEIVINHIDNNPLNNHLSNLELVSPRYNTSCHKIDAGITKIPNGKYKAQILINNKKISLGTFSDKKEALEMYQRASNNIHLYKGNNKEFRELLRTYFYE